MKRFMFLVFSAAVACGISYAADSVLTFENAISGRYAGESYVGVTPLPRSQHYAVLREDGRGIDRYSFQTGRKDGVLWELSAMKDCPLKEITGFTLSPDGSKILLQTDRRKIYRRSFTASYYIYIVGNTSVEPIAEGAAVECPVFSPDGNLVAYVREGNIWLVKLLYGNSESQVTKDGADGTGGNAGTVYNGKPDWLYEEEFSMSRAIEFSPDNEMLCWIRWDDTLVGTYSWQLYEGEAPSRKEFEYHPGLFSLRYPKAGTPNPTVSVHSFDIKSRVTRRLKVPAFTDDYIPRIRFTAESDGLAVMVLNRNQTRLDVYRANPRSGECKLLLREEAKYYIYEELFDGIRFYPDGFSFISERSGWQHLYYYSTTGTLRKQITSGEQEVLEFYGYDAANGNFYYRATVPGDPLRTSVFATNMRTGKTTCLMSQAGTNEALFSAGLSHFIGTHSTMLTPEEVSLYDAKGKQLATLIDNAALRADVSALVNKPTMEFFDFQTADGTKLYGWLMKPAGFTSSRQYPLIIYQYSGPKYQEVFDGWGIGSTGNPYGFEAYLTTQGFVVACIDPRGTGCRGADFSGAIYKDFGRLEAIDMQEGARYLGSLSYINKERIGIWGWSHGGYVAAMSLMHPQHAFRAAVSVAPVADWRYYDSAYTERFMRTPQENPDGYRTSSLLEQAQHLEGRFLLIHGLADDNVHYQSTAQLSERLVQLGKQFEMQVYTNRNHNISGAGTRSHLYTRIVNFFKASL